MKNHKNQNEETIEMNSGASLQIDQLRNRNKSLADTLVIKQKDIESFENHVKVPEDKEFGQTTQRY